MSLRKVRAALAAAMIAVIATGTGIAGAHGAAKPAEKALSERERAAQAARDTVAMLEPGRLQARKLLALVANAATLQTEHYRAEAALQPEVLAAFTEFAYEDRLGQGFSRAVEQRTSAASRQAKALDEQLSADLRKLEFDARALLSTSQRELIEPPPKSDPSLPTNTTDESAQRLAAARRELADLQRELHPAPGVIAQRLLHPAAGESLAQIAAVPVPEEVRQALVVSDTGTDEFPRQAFAEQQLAIKKLRTEINNWNLINGLNLTSEQIDQIGILYDHRPLEKTYKPFAATCKFDLERAVAAVLNAGQRQVLSEYKACLVPPRNLKDPVRVGQASDRSQMEQWLSRARKLAPAKLPEFIEKKLAEEAEHYGKLDAAAQQRRGALLTATVRKAAALSDVDFEVSKAELAKTISPCDRPAELKSEIERLAGAQGQTGAITRFMLNPEFIAQMRLRQQQLAAAPQPAQIQTRAAPRQQATP